MARRTFTAEDATGRIVTQVDPVAMHLIRLFTPGAFGRTDLIPRSELRSIAAEIDVGWGRRGHWVVLTYVVGLLALAAGIWAENWRRSASSVAWLFFAPCVLTCVGTFVATWLGGKHARTRRSCLVMLKHRRCPHCAYDLQALPVEADGSATVCPECGCAWRLDDPQAEAWLEADDQRREELRRKNRKIVFLMTLLLALGVVMGIVQWARYASAKRAAPGGVRPAMTQPAPAPDEEP